jgi:regulator of sirC expression with transglutaminase-like and TPR domain
VSALKVPSPARIDALLRLITDPNESIARRIQEELACMGPPVLPALKKAFDQDQTLKARLNWVFDEIHFGQLRQRFQAFSEATPVDWEQGAFLIAQLAYPHLNVPDYQEKLDQLAQEFGAEWKLEALPPQDAARHLADFLFKTKGFSGNREQYYEPDNSFVNRVIDRRVGIPITLSAILVFVGNRLELPLVGVGMPGHFLVRIQGTAPPLFLDGFNRGAVLREEHCRQFIASTGLKVDPRYLEASPPLIILARMLRNLLGIYKEAQQIEPARRIEILLDSLEE